MRVIQVLTTLSFGDAVGNDTLAIMELLRKNGYEDTAIYAENLDQRIASIPGVRKIEELGELEPTDVMIYHLSTGSALNRQIKSYHCRKLLIYHNVTPSDFFSEYSPRLESLCAKGRAEVSMLRDVFEAGICDSEYNRKELIDMGYKCPLYVCPILIPFSDYKKEPDADVLSKYGSDGVKNIVFVGRIVPNKKQENLISLLYTYKAMYPSDKIRLILVGSANGTENYNQRLKDYASSIGLKVDSDVVFTGQVSFASILAYYKVSSAFVCMSEHEGFCVPLVEAMCFDKPILAANHAAIAGTLGGSGILLDSSDMARNAFYLHEVLNDSTLCDSIIEGQRKRLKDFSYESVSELLMKQINEFINK